MTKVDSGTDKLASRAATTVWLQVKIDDCDFRVFDRKQMARIENAATQFVFGCRTAEQSTD